MRGLLDWIRPPEDADWKAVNRWRWNVSLSLLVMLIGGGYLLKNVAWASDVEKKVETVVAEKLKPIALEQKAQGDKIEAQGKKLDRMADLISDALAESTSAKIREAIRKRCRAAPFSLERDNIVAELGRLRAAYEQYAGKPYIEPSCGDI